MTRKEFIDTLNQFEKEHPVDQWTVGNVHVWPLIKIDLFFLWMNKVDSIAKKAAEINNPQNINDQHSRNIINKITSKLYAEWRGLSFLLKLLLLPKSKEKTVLLIENSGCLINSNHKIINRYYQPILEYISTKNKGSYQIISDSFDTDKRLKEEKNQIKYADLQLTTSFLQHFFRSKVYTCKFPELDSLVKIFGDEDLGIFNEKTFEQRINAQIHNFKTSAELIKLIYKKWNIKAVMMLCYYDRFRYPFLLAAHQTNIPTYDIQHGGVGQEHVAYGHWVNVPEKGFELLPKYFWTWDTSSFNVVHPWSQKQKYHEVFIGGNPWFDYFFNQDYSNYQFPKSKKIILYTMQFPILEEYILQTIQKSSDDYEWWIRIHPRMLNSVPEMKSIIKEWSISHKVNIDDATAYPLPLILKNSTVHISAFSGSITEATQLGIQSIIISEIGVSAFQQYINEGMAIAVLSNNANDLWSAIQKIENSKFENKVELNIHSTYKQIIDKILE